MFEEMVDGIINNLELYHQTFYDADPFSKPGLYFHKRALENTPQKFEYIYAMLVAWGMQRSGRRSGPQMKCFSDFEISLQGLNNVIESIQNISIENLNEDILNNIHTLFINIDIMEGSRKLVGHSKVMAHLAPNLVAPIDGKYTLRYLQDEPALWINWYDVESQWENFRLIHEEFIRPISLNPAFQELAVYWLAQSTDEFYLDTSIPKIIDNLVVGAMKLR